MAREPRLDALVILYHLWSIELSDGQFLLMIVTKMSLSVVYQKPGACLLVQSSLNKQYLPKNLVCVRRIFMWLLLEWNGAGNLIEKPWKGDADKYCMNWQRPLSAIILV